jgi:hypothetical protein
MNRLAPSTHGYAGQAPVLGRTVLPACPEPVLTCAERVEAAGRMAGVEDKGWKNVVACS